MTDLDLKDWAKLRKANKGFGKHKFVDICCVFNPKILIECVAWNLVEEANDVRAKETIQSA